MIGAWRPATFAGCSWRCWPRWLLRRAPPRAPDGADRAPAAARAAVGLQPSRPAGAPSASPSQRPTRWPPRPATRCSRPAARAIDAAMAVQMVLTLVEPQSSGIGGGALHPALGRRARRSLRRSRNRAGAGRRAPVPATPTASRCRSCEAVVGGRSVGVPGALRMLEMRASRARRACPGPQLFEPAITLAEQGFAVSPRLHAQLAGRAAAAPAAERRGVLLRHRGPTLAGRPCAEESGAGRGAARDRRERGSDAFYRGPSRPTWSAACRGFPGNPGRSTEADLARYRARGARGDLHRLEGDVPGVRLSAAVVGASGGDADPEADRVQAPRWTRPLAEGVPCAGVAAPVHRGRAAGIRRSCPVRRRPGFRAPAGRPLEQPARRRLPAPACAG